MTVTWSPEVKVTPGVSQRLSQREPRHVGPDRESSTGVDGEAIGELITEVGGVGAEEVEREGPVERVAALIST